MRIATLIISLALSLVVFVQSCAAGVGGSFDQSFGQSVAEKDKGADLAGAGSMGFLAAVVWILGAGLVLSRPRVSMYLYALAVPILAAAGASGYADAYVWAFASLVFAVMAWRGIAERAKKEERDRASYAADIAAAAAALNRPQSTDSRATGTGDGHE